MASALDTPPAPATLLPDLAGGLCATSLPLRSTSSHPPAGSVCGAVVLRIWPLVLQLCGLHTWRCSALALEMDALLLMLQHHTQWQGAESSVGCALRSAERGPIRRAQGRGVGRSAPGWGLCTWGQRRGGGGGRGRSPPAPAHHGSRSPRSRAAAASLWMRDSSSSCCCTWREDVRAEHALQVRRGHRGQPGAREWVLLNEVTDHVKARVHPNSG